MLIITYTIVAVLGWISTVSGDLEPQCTSRFDYDYKLLKTLVSLESEIEKLKAQQQELSDALQVLQRGQPRTAFTATMSADKSDIPNHTTIVFDVVITNKGGAYSPSNGIFTCKTAGVYVFAWVTTNKNRTWMNTELMLNGEKKGTAMSDSGDINDYSVAANTVSLELQVGDQVWVRAGTWHNGKLAGEWRTTFTGWQL